MAESGLDAVVQIFQRDFGDGEEVEPLDVLERLPNQFRELGLGADDAVELVRDGGDVRGKEARVVAPGAPWRRDGAADEMNRREIRRDHMLGELGPRPAGRLRRGVGLPAEQEAGLLERLADRGERERLRVGMGGDASP